MTYVSIHHHNVVESSFPAVSLSFSLLLFLSVASFSSDLCHRHRSWWVCSDVVLHFVPHPIIKIESTTTTTTTKRHRKRKAVILRRPELAVRFTKIFPFLKRSALMRIEMRVCPFLSLSRSLAIVDIFSSLNMPKYYREISAYLETIWSLSLPSVCVSFSFPSFYSNASCVGNDLLVYFLHRVASADIERDKDKLVDAFEPFSNDTPTSHRKWSEKLRLLFDNLRENCGNNQGNRRSRRRNECFAVIWSAIKINRCVIFSFSL